MRYRRIHEPGGTYFFILIAYKRQPIFANPDAIARYRRAVTTVQAKRPFTLDAEVILHDHLHVLWTLPEGDADYPTRWRLIKSAFTKSQVEAAEPSISRQSKHEQAVWQRRYWEHTIRDEADFQTHMDCIHFNPVQHGYVTAARDWPHSTFQQWVDRGRYDPWWGSDDLPPFPDWAKDWGRCE
jgi:putative transposase